MQLSFIFYVISFLTYSKQIFCNELSQSYSIFPSKLREIDNIVHQLLEMLPEQKSEYSVENPIDCTDIFKNGVNQSGIYEIWPRNRTKEPFSFPVYCDMETDGGGWTVFHRRGNFNNPKDYFYRNWRSFSEGFGQLDNEFWLGNDKLHSLTHHGEYVLRYDMKDKNGDHHYAQYKKFEIGNNEESYQLRVSGCNGDACDPLTHYHDGMRFSTYDKDNDLIPPNCADLYKVGWWFGACLYSNVSGIYKSDFLRSGTYGVAWFHWEGSYYSLPEVELKIRRIRK
ncbi:techylectin-5A-like [Centruroides sculpturatus]|uniref:techylectin-5A-like n=1 Tax=Centruroides sculpturatus TaxID=218467 RepID=UPI000C6CA4BF|nr:techylectin-5A-like [Centruroides sculpturatus]